MTDGVNNDAELRRVYLINAKRFTDEEREQGAIDGD